MDDIATNTLLTDGIGPPERADRARPALAAYPHSTSGSLAEQVTDLITDLLHLLEAEEHTPDEVENVPYSAVHHYVSERGNTDEALPDDGTLYNRWDDGPAAPKTYDHDALPDDLPEPGDRCKECREDIVWIGPSPAADWLHVNDERNR